ncbi:signal peptidase II [Aliikangiella sp. IMCC44359]|uniref:signal peptidase II n=1 Tax=Aliikangiella sp. IMCC44359 TaxID=3459125 RepID=UPI00403AE871
MNFRKRLTVILLTLFCTVGLDQVTKLMAFRLLKGVATQSYLYDILRLDYTENIGAFLGLGNTLPVEVRFWVFTVVVGIVLLGILIYLLLRKKIDMVELTSLSLILSGGMSNFYDRAFNSGAVVDFLNIGIGSLRTGIFNIADVAIMLGAIILIIYSFKQQREVSS